LRKPAHGTVVAYVALFLAMSGTAVAATGGNFILGQSNSAGATTGLSNTGTGPALKVSTASGATPPLSVSGNTTMVPGLNANLLGGFAAGAFQKRVTGKCLGNAAIRTVKADGTVVCTNPLPDLTQLGELNWYGR